ncbi:MAG TPA: hypothetical protein VIA62_14925 [Thermoanaerobaculia bacterium]|nr:hypothetical protein [Thermoanaerobaculia bacterium]
MKMKMKQVFLLLALALGAGTAIHAQGAGVSRFEGRWEGAIVTVRAVQEGDIVLQLIANPDGKLVGLASLPIAHVEDHPLLEVKAQGSELSFVYRDDAGSSLVKATLSADGKRLDGDMEEAGKHYAIYFKRKPAPVLAHPVRNLSLDGHELREQFNRDADHVRLLVMLSPTCHKCLSEARLTQRYLMEQVDDPRLRLYVVWGPMQKDETEEAAQKAALDLEDSRVIHYWLPDEKLIQSFSKPMHLQPPAYSIFFLFPAHATWTGELPPLDDYMHKFWYGKLPADREYDGIKLARKVRDLLASK